MASTKWKIFHCCLLSSIIQFSQFRDESSKFFDPKSSSSILRRTKEGDRWNLIKNTSKGDNKIKTSFRLSGLIRIFASIKHQIQLLTEVKKLIGTLEDEKTESEGQVTEEVK